MADSNNPGQFGNRSDIEKQASKGDQASGGNFANDPERPSEAGKKGAKNQPTEAKRRVGENSRRS